MAIVFDTSVVAAWALRDESHNTVATTLARRLPREIAVVPGIFWYEIRNVLLRAERHERIREDETTAFLERLGMLVETDSAHNEDATLSLARQHGLTVYDVAYLETALRRRADLATFDRELAGAARAEGVSNPADDVLGREV